MNKGNRTGHLTLVKRGASSAAPVIEPVESLSPDALRIAERLKAATGRAGAIVGVIRGRSDWDLRLVLLVRDELRLLRVTSPVGAINKNSTRIVALLQRAKNTPVLAPFEFGEFDGRVWVERRYFNETLAQSAERHMDLLPALVAAVKDLGQQSIVHGNICPSNIALYAGKFVLLDFGFASWAAPSDPALAASCAPELATGITSTATDVFGIGQVAIANMSGEESPAKESFLRSLVQLDAGARPELAELEDFVGGVRSRETANPNSKVLGAGKLISVESLPAVVPQAKGREYEDHEPEQPVKQEVKSAVAETKLATITVPKSTVIPVLVVTLILVAYVAFFGGERANVADDELADAWSSNQPSMMTVVAERALGGDRGAQTVIVSDAMRGVQRPLVRSELIKLGFFPQWEAELSDDDREILLSLALSELRPIKRLPALRSAHPAVLLAIAAEFPLDSDSAILSETSAEQLSKMPGVIGTVFKTYMGTAEIALADKPLRALARIALGRGDANSIQTFMGSLDTWGARIVALAPLFAVQSKLPSEIISAMQADRTFQRVMLWFQGEPMARWSAVADVVKLSVIAGVIPDSKVISIESLADLLAFPSQAVRNSAVRALKSRIGDAVPDGVLSLLSADSAGLSRASIISFVGALQLAGDEREALLARWFDTNPGAEIVTALLLAWNNSRDAFPVLAARYLIDNNQERLSPEVAQKLVLHGEALVRAYAYSKLSPTDSTELQILTSMAQVEPNQRLREQLAEKIAEGRES